MGVLVSGVRRGGPASRAPLFDTQTRASASIHTDTAQPVLFLGNGHTNLLSRSKLPSDREKPEAHVRAASLGRERAGAGAWARPSRAGQGQAGIDMENYTEVALIGKGSYGKVFKVRPGL